MDNEKPVIEFTENYEQAKLRFRKYAPLVALTHVIIMYLNTTKAPQVSNAIQKIITTNLQEKSEDPIVINDEFKFIRIMATTKPFIPGSDFEYLFTKAISSMNVNMNTVGLILKEVKGMKATKEVVAEVVELISDENIT